MSEKPHDVNPIPDDYHYHGCIPYLNVNDGHRAIDFYRKAFGANEVVSFPRQGGKLAHAEMRIGDAVFMLRDEYPEYNFLSPATIGGTPVNLLIYVPDVHSFAERAVAGGATVVRPVEQQFHGDLMIELTDPFGHSWFFASRVQEMTVEDTKQAAADNKI